MSAISTISRVPSPPPDLSLYRFTPEQLRRLTEANILPENGVPAPVRFTVDQYQRMITLGIVPEDTPVELLDGWIVNKMARNPPHDSAILRTQTALIRRLPANWFCRGQSGMTTDTSQPEPDLAVVPGPLELYDHHHPTGHEMALVIEVSDSTLARDRNVKAPLYAQGGTPIYWILNIIDDWVEVYTEPTAEAGYQRRQDYRRTESVPLVITGSEIATIPVQEILPGPAPT